VENHIRSGGAEIRIATGLTKLLRVTKPGTGNGVYNLWIILNCGGGAR
jgi:hypothetical protein